MKISDILQSMHFMTAFHRIKSLSQPPNRPLVIAISGFGGSGKTTVANDIAARLKDTQIVSIDSFSQHEWRRSADWDNFDRARFEKQILERAHANTFPLEYGREPWPGYAEGLVTVPRVSYLIVEGCSIFHPDLLQYYDYKIWVDCSLKEATRRGMQRDRHDNNDEQDYYWQTIWMPNEKDFFAKYRPDRVADVKVETTP